MSLKVMSQARSTREGLELKMVDFWMPLFTPMAQRPALNSWTE